MIEKINKLKVSDRIWNELILLSKAELDKYVSDAVANQVKKDKL